MVNIPIHHERTNGQFVHISPTVLRRDETFGCRVHRHKHTLQLPQRAQYVQMVDDISPALLLGTCVSLACFIGLFVWGLFELARFVLSHWRP